MNKLLYTIFLIVLLPANSVLGQTMDSLLVGRWLVNYDKTVALMPDESHAEYDSLSNEVKDELRQNLEGQAFEFFSDHRFTAITASGDSYPGSWAVDEDDQKLTLTYDQGTELTEPIERLSDQELILKITSDSSKALFHFLHLDLESR